MGTVTEQAATDVLLSQHRLQISLDFVHQVQIDWQFQSPTLVKLQQARQAAVAVRQLRLQRIEQLTVRLDDLEAEAFALIQVVGTHKCE